MRFFFMERVIRALSEGGVFRRVLGIVLRVCAVVVAVAALVGWIAFWWRVDPGAPAGVILGTVLFQAIYVVTAYCVVHTIWIRANDIQALPDTGYAIIPIVAVLAKLAGEVAAATVLGLGMGAGILLLFGGHYYSHGYYGQAEEAPFLGSTGVPGGALFRGLAQLCPLPISIVGFGVRPFAAFAFILGSATVFLLVGAYLISELLTAFLEITMNTRNSRRPAPPVDQCEPDGD